MNSLPLTKVDDKYNSVVDIITRLKVSLLEVYLSTVEYNSTACLPKPKSLPNKSMKLFPLTDVYSVVLPSMVKYVVIVPLTPVSIV